MADDRFGRTAEQMAARQDARAEELAEGVRSFVLAAGDERALDAGCGAGALAFALAPLVREVVGVDRVPELLEQARRRAPRNVELAAGDIERLGYPNGSFDLAGTLRTLHHVSRPERVLAELTRVTRAGGRVLVIDQLAPDDPDAAVAVDRFERARDPAHCRLLPDSELQRLFEANDLTLLRSRRDQERRRLDAYLDLAGCEGPERDRVLALGPEGRHSYTAVLGWYLLERQIP